MYPKQRLQFFIEKCNDESFAFKCYMMITCIANYEKALSLYGRMPKMFKGYKIEWVISRTHKKFW